MYTKVNTPKRKLGSFVQRINTLLNFWLSVQPLKFKVYTLCCVFNIPVWNIVCMASIKVAKQSEERNTKEAMDPTTYK